MTVTGGVREGGDVRQAPVGEMVIGCRDVDEQSTGVGELVELNLEFAGSRGVL